MVCQSLLLINVVVGVVTRNSSSMRNSTCGVHEAAWSSFLLSAAESAAEAASVGAAAQGDCALKAHPLSGPEPSGTAAVGTAQQSSAAHEEPQRVAHKQILSRETLLPKELDLQLRQVFARGQDVEHGGLSAGASASRALSIISR